MTLFQLIYILGVLFNILGYVRKQEPFEVRKQAFIDKHGEFGERILKDCEPYFAIQLRFEWLYRILFTIGSFFSWIIVFIFIIYLGFKFGWWKDLPVDGFK